MKNNKGFTLVEIIVTVVMISVLMAITFPIATNVIEHVRDNKMLSEANSVLQVAQSRINRLSLSGNLSFSDDLNEEYHIDSTEKAEIVTKASGTGFLTELVYYQGEVTYLRYVLGGRAIVYKISDQVVKFEDDLTPKDIADFLFSNADTLNVILTKIRSNIDSNAPSANTDASLVGATGMLLDLLAKNGMDTENMTWRISKVAKGTCPTHGDSVDRYQILIVDQKVTEDMKGSKLSADKFIYYGCGQEDVAYSNQKTTVTVDISTTSSGSQYAVIK